MQRKKSSGLDIKNIPSSSTGRLKRKSRSGPSTFGILILIIQCLFILVGLFLFVSTKTPQKNNENSNHNGFNENIDEKLKQLQKFQQNSPEVFENLLKISGAKLRGKSNIAMDNLIKPAKVSENDEKSEFFETRVKILQEQIQLISRREVLEK